MLLAVKGGLSSGGVGTCRMGSGGALDVKGSVTPGIDGIKGGRERAEVSAVRLARTVVLCFMMQYRPNERLCVMKEGMNG